MAMYIHLDGTQVGHADPVGQPREEQIDRWFPGKPADMTKVGKVIEDTYADEKEFFHKIYDFKAGLSLGGIHLPVTHGSIGIDARYKGKIEVWKDN